MKKFFGFKKARASEADAATPAAAAASTPAIVQPGNSTIVLTESGVVLSPTSGPCEVHR
jgi:hypothetical protein